MLATVGHQGVQEARALRGWTEQAEGELDRQFGAATVAVSIVDCCDAEEASFHQPRKQPKRQGCTFKMN